MSKSIGEVREAIIAATELGQPFGANVHESKEVVVRTKDGTYHQIDEVAVTALGGLFVMLLEASPKEFS